MTLGSARRCLILLSLIFFVQSVDSLSTKVTPNGKACIVYPNGQGSLRSAASTSKGSDNDDSQLETLWVEFDYDLETPNYVQTNFNAKDRVRAVERLFHNYLSEHLLGCKESDAYVFPVSNKENPVTVIPRSDKPVEKSKSGTSDILSASLDLVVGINQSPTDVEIGTCEPQMIMNECRRYRAFLIVVLKRSQDKIKILDGTGFDLFEMARVQVMKETVTILNNAMAAGYFNDQFVDEIFVSRVRPSTDEADHDVEASSEKKKLESEERHSSFTVEGNNFNDGDGDTDTRKKMSSTQAYGIIFLCGIVVVSIAVLALVRKAYHDGSHQQYRHHTSKKNSNRKNGRNENQPWDCSNVFDLESVSDDDVEVMLYIRSSPIASEKSENEAAECEVPRSTWTRFDSFNAFTSALSPRASMASASPKSPQVSKSATTSEMEKKSKRDKAAGEDDATVDTAMSSEYSLSGFMGFMQSTQAQPKTNGKCSPI